MELLIIICVALIGGGFFLLRSSGGNAPSVQRFNPLQARGLFSTPEQRRDPDLPAEMPPQPEPPPTKILCYVGGVVCWLMAASTFAAVAQGGVVPCLFSVVLFGAGIALFKAGYEADEQHAKNMGARAAAQAQHAQYERERIATENARREAQRAAQLQELQDKAAKEQFEADRLAAIQRQKDIQHQETLRPLAEGYGIDVPSAIQMNVKKIENQLELDKRGRQDKLDTAKRWEEIQQDLRAGDLLSLGANQQINELLSDLEKAVGKLAQIERGEILDDATGTLRTTYRKNIETITGQIDDYQARLRVSENGQAPKGLAGRASNSRADYPPETDEDAI